jgi:hypothetical protein
MTAETTGSTTGARSPARLVDSNRVRAFLETEFGRAMLRRELEEGAQVKQGQHALLLGDPDPSGAHEAELNAVADTLRELGLTVSLMRVDTLVPPFPGAVPVCFMGVVKQRIPPVIYEAIRAADVTFNLTSTGRGAGRYTQDFFTLTTYYGKHVDGGRTVEGPEILGTDAEPDVPDFEALQYPSDLLRTIADKLVDILTATAEQQGEFRMTNPWGTDLRLAVLPGDIAMRGGGIRRYPNTDRFRGEDNGWLYRAAVGVNVPQVCEGVWVTKDCSLLGGELREPMRVHLKDGFFVGADGADGARFMELLADDPTGVHALLMGINPKVAPFRRGRYIYRNHGIAAGTAHIGAGAPGLFYRAGAWGGLGNRHFELGNIPRISFRAGDTPIFEDGRLLILADPAVREAARQYGDPDELLRQFEWGDTPLT